MAEMAPGPGEKEMAQDAAKKASQVESGMMVAISANVKTALGDAGRFYSGHLLYCVT
jgi:hypothetical protein